MDVHVRDLRYFVAVADELHFTRAAESLRVSQPSLSRQIRVLERDLGFSLFQRDRRTVTLTGAGVALLPRARELLGAWEDALAEGTQRAREAAARLRVGFQTGVAGPVYQVTVTRFKQEHPHWTVELKLHPWSDPTAGLLDGNSDVAFVWLPIAGNERLAGRTLWTEPRHVALWCTHPLAEQAELRISDLLDEPFEAVAARLGVALLSAGNAQIYSRPEIVTRPVVDISDAEFAIAWRAGDERPTVRDFAEAAEEAIRICATPDTATTDANKRGLVEHR